MKNKIIIHILRIVFIFPFFTYQINTVYSQGWVQIGQDLVGSDSLNEFGGITVLSADGKRVAIYSSRNPNNIFYDTLEVAIYEFNDSLDLWTPLGEKFIRLSRFGQFIYNIIDSYYFDFSPDGGTFIFKYKDEPNQNFRPVIEVRTYENGKWKLKGPRFFNISDGTRMNLSRDGNQIVFKSGIDIEVYEYTLSNDWKLSGNLKDTTGGGYSVNYSNVQINEEGKIVFSSNTHNFNNKSYIVARSYAEDNQIWRKESELVYPPGSSSYPRSIFDSDGKSILVRNKISSPDSSSLVFNVYKLDSLGSWKQFSTSIEESSPLNADIAIEDQGNVFAFYASTNTSEFGVKLYNYTKNGWENDSTGIHLEITSDFNDFIRYPSRRIQTPISLSKNGGIIAVSNTSFRSKGPYTGRVRIFSKCNTSIDTVKINSCGDYYWELNQKVYTSSGLYTDTTLNSFLCDSIVTIDLTISSPSDSSIIKFSCDEYYWEVSKMTYDSSGIYKDTILNRLGCDSVISLNLTINRSSTKTQKEKACEAYLWEQNGTIYTASGNYLDTIKSSNGCDSIVNLDLDIHNTNDTISFKNRSLLASENQTTYQWIDCNDNFKIIEGETKSFLVLESTGSYAVIVSKDICVDTSNCFTVDYLKNNNCNSSSPIVFPNPTSRFVNVDLCKEYPLVKVSIRTVEGKLVSENEYQNTSSIRLFTILSSATYLVEINTGETITVHKVFIDR